MRRGDRIAWLLAAVLCACAGPKKSAEEMPTLRTLAGRTVQVVPDQSVVGTQERTIAAYQEFLKSAPNDPQRPEAMRRIGDLQMDLADVRAAGDKSSTGAPDYKAAVQLYQEFLRHYPKDPGNDRVLYQMARAYEQGGELETALATLDRLVKEYPNTRYRDEGQFRRGEMLFAMRDYAKAETAYGTVLRGDTKSPYYERSLYMQGWSVYKEGRLDEALNSFFGVLDLKLAGRSEQTSLDKIPGLSRGDRELLDDTFRVTSLSLENLQGADSIAAYMTTPARHQYEFRVYQQLAELYIKQERFKDAADTFNAFAHHYPLHPQAPLLQARVIEIYQKTGFATLALEAKKDYVAQYGARGKFRQANPAAWEEHVQPIVKTDLAELAQQYHASAQKSKKTEDYQEAVHWYRDYLESFPSDPQAAQTNFLLAELLFEDKRFAEAAPEYEKAAYQYPHHPKSADAGYAALLSYAELEKKMPAGEPLKAMQRTGIDSALRFARTFPDDPRTGAVLSNAADRLYTMHDLDRARSVAQQVVELKPPAAAAQRRVAWTVIAHTAFERGEFDHAEHAYGEVLALTADNDPTRKELTERVAASIYKQGEQARDKGDLRAAVGHFGRVATAAPQSTVRANAEYDAAAALIGLKDWDAASRALEGFRRSYPDHPLQSEISGKLAVVYTEQGKWALAAPEFERLAATRKDPQLAREALWQAAELYEKAGARQPAAGVYERYVKQYPEPLEAAVEARYRLARFAKQDGNGARELAWMQDIFRADQAGGAARTDRTRYLGATAALALAVPVFDEYHKVALVEPLKTQLKLKKAKMEEALKAYAVAADYGVADVATQATYRVAELYHDFGRSLLASQRPKSLSKDELEQYDVMLEEQAYPFEEKAIELHELNARHSADGIYDEWVRKSYVALGELRPVRYAKTERSEVAIDAIR
ncbi:MAG TPA: tetratricopeptide repeat protein [Burkholderiaceae bacterium]|nr:tetratricopeptide repeat protein [Burkholderiaceae bacterium]